MIKYLLSFGWRAHHAPPLHIGINLLVYGEISDALIHRNRGKFLRRFKEPPLNRDAQVRVLAPQPASPVSTGQKVKSESKLARYRSTTSGEPARLKRTKRHRRCSLPSSNGRTANANCQRGRSSTLPTLRQICPTSVSSSLLWAPCTRALWAHRPDADTSPNGTEWTWQSQRLTYYSSELN
jgi:hypothetical protein